MELAAGLCGGGVLLLVLIAIGLIGLVGVAVVVLKWSVIASYLFKPEEPIQQDAVYTLDQSGDAAEEQCVGRAGFLRPDRSPQM